MAGARTVVLGFEKQLVILVSKLFVSSFQNAFCSRFQMGTLLLLFCLCFAALLTPPMLSMAQAHEDEIKPPPGRPAEDLKTPEMQYFINIAPLPPGKPCNSPSSHNQVVNFRVVMPLLVCFFLWLLGYSFYRGRRLRRQQATSVAFANSDGIPPAISELPIDNSPELPTDNSPELPTDNSPVNSPELPTELPTDNSPVNSPELPTVNSPELPSGNFHSPRTLFWPSAPPLELLACHRCGYPQCEIFPSQFVCPSCGTCGHLISTSFN